MTANILIVEDSPSMRSVVRGVVEHIGHRPLEANSGEEALEMISSNKVDLVVLDVQLPGIDGFATCERLRELRPDDWFPVIYLSASHTDENIVRGLDAGGDAYVAKPVNPRVLKAILQAMGRIGDMKQELAAANRELRKLAQYDGLTKILNRRGFDEALKRYWRQSQRDHTDMALLFLDIDQFKQYNDHYGHLQGDECLKSIASALEESMLRPVDLASRYGGEEFAMLLPNTPRLGALIVAERALQTINDLAIPHAASSIASHVTGSLGLAMASHAESLEDLKNRADMALYRAKKAGRNRLAVDDGELLRAP